MRPILFTAFLATYTLLCGYVGWRSAQALPAMLWVRVAWLVGIAILSTGFFTGMALREFHVLGVPIGYWLRTLGVTWIISISYWLVAVLFCDALRIAERRWHFAPPWIGEHYAAVKLAALGLSVLIVAAIFVVGYFRFANPVTSSLTLKINKRADSVRTLHIAVASDWHLGDLIGRERALDYVARVNALGADLILLPGDLIDRSVQTVITGNMGEALEKLHAPLGVYAILGNHEGYAGAAASTAFLEKHGIRVLRDEVVSIAGGAFYVAGRIDHEPRASIETLLAGVDRTKPIILMDHQPRALESPAAAGVDLQFSGHTHGGQVWPATWVVPFLYDVAYGYKRRGDFQI